MLCSLWLLPLARSFVANTPPPKAHRRATPSGVEEKETPELDWRAFRAKLEGAGMTLDLLRETGVGKTVNALKKLTVAPPLAGRARALVDQWKTLQIKKE